MNGFSEDDLPPKGGGKPKRPKRRFHLKRFGEIKPATKPNYLIKGILPRVGLAVVWGEPKCGKSFWTFDAVMHVVLNWQYRGRKVQPGPAVYCALEGGVGFSRRVEAWRQQYLLTDHEDPPFYLLDVPLDLIADHKELIETIKEQLGDEGPPAVVTIDTLNRALAGSENKPEDMAKFIRAADAIYTEFGCLVVIVHHCGVEGMRPRGHTSLPGADDAQIKVSRDSNGTGIITTTVEYMKDDEAGATVLSRLERVEIGPDDDGDEMSSCVIVACDSFQRAAGGQDDWGGKDGKGSKGLKALRRAIMALMADCGEPITPRAGEPVVQALKLDYVRTEFLKSWPADGETERKRKQAKTTAFRRALADAVDRGVIETRELNGEDFVWLAGVAEAAPAADKTNGGGETSIPFMITAAMKQDLKARGFSDDDIFAMTPQHARDILADENRNPDTERFRVVGEVMRNDTCVKCGEGDGVRLLKDTRTGGKPMPLHLRCAREWFDSKDVPPPD
jgi:hypothetical protein